ncbi:hypothetical protein PN498_19970 [Oscillatoria sp. CS-180]|uniref:hypothetical protein n=1 Tax=Oscillatoria sp. CS-180 TaxID=3021720 RepID=UPI00232F3BF9|nr:hypothetical protein [Oscillatoria sp. CS-180]MDB9528280.1 hypothetical protein [Oscillatoria sp. CS-180]
MEKIKGQANKVGELLFAADTGATYKKAVVLTWDILRETGVLLWLIICLVFVAGEWFWKSSINLGQRTRDWYEGLQQPDDTETEPKTIANMSKSAADSLASGTETLLYRAKQQLGIQAEPPAPKLPKPKPSISQPTVESSPSQSEPTVKSSPSSPTPPSEPPEVGEPPVQPTPPNVVAKYNSPEETEAPGTKTALAAAANQSQKIDESDEAVPENDE